MLQELRQKAHTELARLQPWDEWRLRGKIYCSLNLIPIQCVYENCRNRNLGKSSLHHQKYTKEKKKRNQKQHKVWTSKTFKDIGVSNSVLIEDAQKQLLLTEDRKNKGKGDCLCERTIMPLWKITCHRRTKIKRSKIPY